MRLFPGQKVVPQPSERWVMYSLLCPVVDAANAKSGLMSYFEYSTPNGSNRRLSADIALLDEMHIPVWMIEAKKFDRHIDSRMVEPYLITGVMGCVTNGKDWILCTKDEVVQSLTMIQNGTVNADAWNALVDMLACRTLDALKDIKIRTADNDFSLRARKTSEIQMLRCSGGQGSRSFVEKTKFSKLSDAVHFALIYAAQGSQTELFLREVLASGHDISSGYLEVSANRLIWWLNDGRRAIRINLKSTQLEMLVLNDILKSQKVGILKGSLKIHDKNLNMTACKASDDMETKSCLNVFLYRDSGD